MKKILILFLTVLLLAGCAAEPPVTTLPPETTEPPKPNLVEAGKTWDADGVLTEIPLTVPEGWKYTNSMGFNGMLLLYGFDTHLAESTKLEMLLMDPVTGEALAQNTFQTQGYVSPQVLGGRIYLCDPAAGKIYELDESLRSITQWQIDSQEGYWLMGGANTVYQFTNDKLTARNLISGDTRPVISGDPVVYAIGSPGRSVSIEYYHPDTGRNIPAILDLVTGQVMEPPFAGRFSFLSEDDGLWLCSVFNNANVYYLGTDEHPRRVALQDSNLRQIYPGFLLESVLDNNGLKLYRPDGRFVSGCALSETGSYYLRGDPIWNEGLGGFFLHTQSYEGDNRLLFWDIGKGTGGDDLALEDVPEASEAMAQLRQKADELETTYGVTIWIGEECQTEFWDFRAELITDWEEISQELDSLEIALASYPENFFRQLKFDYVQGIQIHLVQNLEATTGDRVGGSYSAFAQQMGDHYMVVSDILVTNEYTYYHEFSHVIDRYLESDSWQREDALYSEDGWSALNPDGFDYTYYYGGDFSWYDYDYHSRWFIDSYATTFPTEDRARVMEYAMMGHSGWYFEGNDGLISKLDYYSRCIRDAFDTTLWPEVTLWEQYLNE